MVYLSIQGIALDDKTHLPLAILQDREGGRRLYVWIGPSEASAIIVELEHIVPPRPSTHDILSYLFLRHGFRPQRMEIYDVDAGDSVDAGESYRARILYRKGWKRYAMEVRPSDGLALAVRLGVPIAARDDLLNRPQGQALRFSGRGESAPEAAFLTDPRPGRA